ncbi:MAG: type II CRISPR RNA-guided endonuclease Cas9 [Proteobacteria bacterium]|nr:type II CRISPR RNA-guided endonuclease Cas9 [Pseudomonadota bacterium]
MPARRIVGRLRHCLAFNPSEENEAPKKSETTVRYRLALDLGSTSLGWAVLSLGPEGAPRAVVKAGVRIFPDGRNPKDGSSLAVTRRAARAMRRRRDRLLRRKARVVQALVDLGFFPSEIAGQKALEGLNPYALRAKGLDSSLTPHEFGRAVFHLNQRRGFLSNRKTDKKDSDSGAMKTAMSAMRAALSPTGADGKARTVGEFLFRRFTDPNKQPQERTVRARYRQARIEKDGGGARIDKSYDLYVDRAMMQAEFNALWAKQAEFDPARYTTEAKRKLDHRLWHQRPLRPVRPGRCTLIPDEERAPLALPSQQRFRILQEVNNLAWLDENLQDRRLSLQQRDALVSALERGNKSFDAAVPKLLELTGSVKFNLADAKRSDLKGNITSIRLAKKDLFGEAWYRFDSSKQDEIALRLLQEESEMALVAWLQAETGVDEARAEAIANTTLPDGYGSLSRKALALVLPELCAGVVSFADAAKAAGFHHSRLSENAEVPGRTVEIEHVMPDTGEIKHFHVFRELPYYGEFLQRHVGFADPDAGPDDPLEKQFGRIANPTVHIALNQVRQVVNALIRHYGHPKEVIIEVARELKQNQEQRQEDQRRQAEQQKRNARLRNSAAELLDCAPEQVKHGDIQRLILWEELSFDAANRRCPYSGVQISAQMVLGPEVEIEHILPFSQTLDDSLNNKTLAVRQANRIKRNRTPWGAHDDFAAQGWDYTGILARAELMPRHKRYRFAVDGYQKWLKGGEDKDGKGFLARALNDTRYMCRVAREYLGLICPQDTRVIPGQMTALLRAKFGLNHVLGLSGEKNRNDHRHHAVDACVVAVTDQGMLQAFAKASAAARERQVHRLVEEVPLPWLTYPDHVRRAVQNIWVSYKPDHGHQGAMHNDTAYSLLGEGRVRFHKVIDGRRTRLDDNLKVIEFANQQANARHGKLPNGEPRPYKGYKGDSNYCIEIFRGDGGRWDWEVVSTFEAYQRVAQVERELRRTGNMDVRTVCRSAVNALRDPSRSLSGKPLILRLMIGDYLRAQFKGKLRLLSVKKIKSNGGIFVAEHHEANVRQREDDKDVSLVYGSFSANSLRKAKGRQVTVSPAGELSDPGFKD